VTIPYFFQFTNVSNAPALPIYIFQFLETLPKLSDIVVDDLTVGVRLQDLQFFPRIAEQTPLHHLSFSLECGSVASGQPIAGPKGLVSLFVKWCVTDDQDPDSKRYARKRSSTQGQIFELRPPLYYMQYIIPTICVGNIYFWLSAFRFI